MASVIGLSTVWEICYVIRMRIGNETFGVAFLILFVAFVLFFVYLSFNVDILISGISSSPLSWRTLPERLSKGDVVRV